MFNERSLFLVNLLLVFTFQTSEVHFQNYSANNLVRWFVFEAVQNTRSSCFIGSKILGYPDKTLQFVF